MNTIDLGVIGNCSFAALVNKDAQIVWFCWPRFDGDPVFHSLLGSPDGDDQTGSFSIHIQNKVSSEQFYDGNTAILITILHAETGTIRITDFAPRFWAFDRPFYPTTLIRRVERISGTPRITLCVRPRFGYGSIEPTITFGSNHIRYCGSEFSIRLTTNAPIGYIMDEIPFNMTGRIDLIFGADEDLSESIEDTSHSYERKTRDYWLHWSHRLAIPYEWQEAVIRAAITLKLCAYEPTGAIVAALTTSIPEAPDSGRNWDYRYCWVRDAYFVVRALNRLAAMRKMETYFSWLMNIVSSPSGERIQPVYGIGRERELEESVSSSLPGYRSMGPVRIGNQAFEHEQNDSYGNIILGVTQAFMDKRLLSPPTKVEYQYLEYIGNLAFDKYDKPDAGMWELRSRSSIHTTSAVMCWAALDRLSIIANSIGLPESATTWKAKSDKIYQLILEKSWSEKRLAFTECFGGDYLDAGVLLMIEVGFISAHHPKMVSTIAQIEKYLAKGPHVLRYEAPDDYGRPSTAFNTCSFWRVDALARQGRDKEARLYFEELLSCRNRLGLLSEDIDINSGEHWGNYPQTYSMVGIINCAVRLSRSWEMSV